MQDENLDASMESVFSRLAEDYRRKNQPEGEKANDDENRRGQTSAAIDNA